MITAREFPIFRGWQYQTIYTIQPYLHVWILVVAASWLRWKGTWAVFTQVLHPFISCEQQSSEEHKRWQRSQIGPDHLFSKGVQHVYAPLFWGNRLSHSPPVGLSLHGSDMGCGGSAQGARVHDLDAFADVSPSNSEVLAKPVPRLEHMRTMELRVISACNGWNWLAPCVNRPHFLLELNSHCRSQDSQSYWFTRTSLTKKTCTIVPKSEVRPTGAKTKKKAANVICWDSNALANELQIKVPPKRWHLCCAVTSWQIQGWCRFKMFQAGEGNLIDHRSIQTSSWNGMMVFLTGFRASRNCTCFSHTKTDEMIVGGLLAPISEGDFDHLMMSPVPIVLESGGKGWCAAEHVEPGTPR